MKLQDCFIGQIVGVNSKSKGVIVGTVSSMFETKDVDTDESIWYADVNDVVEVFNFIQQNCACWAEI